MWQAGDAYTATVQPDRPTHEVIARYYYDHGYSKIVDDSQHLASQIAAAALLIITVPPSLFVFVLSLRRGRRTVEWARQCYSFLLPAFGIFNVFCVLDTLIFCDKVAYTLVRRGWSPGVSNALERAHSYTHPIVRFCDCLTEVFLFLCLTFLGIGLGIARTGYIGLFDRSAKMVAYAMAFVLSVLATVSFGLFLWATGIAGGQLSMNCISGYPCYNTDYDRIVNSAYLRPYRPAMKANYAFVGITWVLSMATVIRAFAIAAGDNRNTERRLRMAGRCLVICSVLWFTRTTFTFAMEIKSGRHDIWRHGHGNLSVDNIVNIPLSIWTVFAIFTLLYALGSHKQTGLYLLATNDPAAQKNLHINQPVKSFQDIEIPMYPEHSRTGLSSRGQEDSPISPQSPSMAGPSPVIAVPQPSYQAPQALYQTPQPSFTVPHEDRIEPAAQVSRESYLPEYQPQRQEQTVQPIDRRVSRLQDPDWARPPSTEPPPHFRSSSPPSHDELMGYNHQADGYTPSAPLPYPMKQ